MSLTKQYFKYVSQNIFGLLGTSCYILADTYFISQAAGTSGVALLNLCLPIYNFIFAIGSMLGLGAATRYAILRAQGDERSERYFSNALLWALVFALPFMLAGIFCPEVLLRFMAIRSERELAQSRRIATIWVVISMFIAVCIGVIGYSVSAAGKVPFLATSAESETIIIKLADLMSQHGVLLAIMAGIILSGILAATMSTADSQLLAAASSVSQDLMQHSFGIKMNQRTTMLAARATVICIAIIGMVLAWDPNSSVFRVVSFAWAGFGAAFGPVMLFSLFWKRANKQGALAGMITGGAVVFIWKYLIAPMGGAWAIYELLPAFLAACIAIVIVSLATPAPEKAVTDTFDEICGK